MTTIYDIINGVKIIIILGLTVRIVYCAVRLQYEQQEAEIYKKRIKNTLVIGVIVMVISGVQTLLEGYFK